MALKTYVSFDLACASFLFNLTIHIANPTIQTIAIANKTIKTAIPIVWPPQSQSPVDFSSSPLSIGYTEIIQVIHA